MMLHTKPTNRKFYGKWLYKVSLRLPGIAILRTHTLCDAVTFLTGPSPNETHHRNSLRVKAHNNASHILKLCVFLKDIPCESWTKRIECNQFDFYTNDQQLFGTCCERFANIVMQSFAPVADNLALLSSQYIILTKKLPHNQYRYKAFLRPHNMKNDRDAKRKYLDWIDMQGAKIRMTQKVRDWFIVTDWNWDRRYVLVEDSATLLMLQMRSGTAIGKIYEYAVVDK